MLRDKAYWIARPRGIGLKVLLETLAESGINIKGSSFDAIYLRGVEQLDFIDKAYLQTVIGDLVFMEIETANQSRVKPGFEGFFFALTESEITPAAALGSRHRVALFNRRTDEVQLTSVAEILRRARSTNWQVSVQL